MTKARSPLVFLDLNIASSFPENYLFLMTMSSFYVFEEARHVHQWRDGRNHFVVSGFLEHWLQAQLELKGYVFGRSKQG
jgi:hypothetical protein